MSEHIVQPRIYIGIFLSLMVGTALTVLAAFYDFPGPLNAVVALTIAVIKATLVVLFFMHVRYSGRLVWLVIVAALLWLAIMFAITFSDYWTRTWLPPLLVKVTPTPHTGVAHAH
jgi:cytochrome c oxidase subunit 4